MINIILDTSGSMSERKSALFYTANTVGQYCDILGIDIKFYNLKGECLASLLDIKFFNDECVFKHMENSVFISDGFQKINDTQFDGIILIGMDSSSEKYKNNSTIIEKAENAIKVIDYIVSLKCISKNSTQRDEEDEW